MATKRARATYKILQASANKKPYSLPTIKSHREKFARNLAIMFPSKPSKRKEQVADIPVHWFFPKVKTDRTIFYVHGGGFVFGSPQTHTQHTKRLAKYCKSNVVSVDYSLAPEKQYPFALEELQRAWLALIDVGQNPAQVTFMGDSAGGNLVMALMLKLRDERLPLPACAVLLSPALDAHFSGESYQTNKDKDPFLDIDKMKFFLNAYVGKAPKGHSYVSPMYANLTGLPPVLLQVGSNELLLSDSKTIANNAVQDKRDMTIEVDEGMWHGYHLFASYVPEAKQAIKRVAAFMNKYIITEGE